MVSQFNGGDVLFTLLFILGIFVVVLFIVRLTLTKQKQSNKSTAIDQKLDRIIELLEQDKK